MSLLTRLWERRSKLTCAACGGRFLSGVIRFENGCKAGPLCPGCADRQEGHPASRVMAELDPSHLDQV
jgi:hypothetical protein